MDPVRISLTRNIKAVNFFFPPHSYRPINRVASKRSVSQKCSSCSPLSVLIPFPAYSSPNFLYSKHTIKIPATVKKISHGGLYAFISHSSGRHTLMQPFSTSAVKCTQHWCTKSCSLSNTARHRCQSVFWPSQSTKVCF